jgi:hypothetical protein
MIALAVVAVAVAAVAAFAFALALAFSFAPTLAFALVFALGLAEAGGEGGMLVFHNDFVEGMVVALAMGICVGLVVLLL